MKQEDKDLLLRDLCGRLPYGVKISKVIDNFISEPHQIRSINLNNIIIEDGEFEDGTPDIDVWDIENIKPYLFPLSSMTEEQREEIEDKLTFPNKSDGGWIEILYNDKYEIPFWFVDFCNKNHLDYRGLIEKSLALDTTGLNIY